VVWVGLLMGLLCLGTQAWAIRTGAHWQTMVFTVLCLSQLGNALAVRSERRSFFAIGACTNRPLLFTVIGTTLLQLGAVYLPWANKVFRTQPLSAAELGTALALSSVIFIAVELEKLVRRGAGRAAGPATAPGAD
jgi:Ca2+-transporting ATPase